MQLFNLRLNLPYFYSVIWTPKFYHIFGHSFGGCSSSCLLHHLLVSESLFLLCSHHLTIYLTILHSFLSVSSRRCGACAAPSAEHARPQASSHTLCIIFNRLSYLTLHSIHILTILQVSSLRHSAKLQFLYFNSNRFHHSCEIYYPILQILLTTWSPLILRTSSFL